MTLFHFNVGKIYNDVTDVTGITEMFITKQRRRDTRYIVQRRLGLEFGPKKLQIPQIVSFLCDNLGGTYNLLRSDEDREDKEMLELQQQLETLP